MSASPDWRIVPYGENSSFKRLRVRDEARISAVVRHLQNDECVSLLGPPLSEKSNMLRDIAAVLEDTGRFSPLYIDLWRTRSDDEAVFFTSLAGLVGAELAQRGLGPATPPVQETVPDPRAFQHYVTDVTNQGSRNVALLIDHLQALPHDLVHSLLLALRSAYMEREADAPRSLVAVVTGGMNLVGLSTGPTSPFNIAKPVVTAPLTVEQSRALAEATAQAYDCSISEQALARIVEWAGGDRYLVPRLAALGAELVQAHRLRRVTSAVIARAADRMCLTTEDLPPMRAAIRMIEEDPDTMLDVLHILDHGMLARSRSRQMPTRTGTDRLQLSGAVVLADGVFRFTNRAYHRGLARHFTTERVGHVLRISGRWAEAIAYLAPRLRQGEEQVAGSRLQVEASTVDTLHPGRAAARTTLEPSNLGVSPARPQLLEAIVQSIYATDAPEQAYELLADGLRLGFGLSNAAVYCAVPARGLLQRVFPPVTASRNGSTAPESVDLHDPTCVEAQTYRLGNYALRGTADEARLIVSLNAGGRSIGVVTVDRYIQHRDPHLLPEELPDLLRYLQHAAGAMDNAIIRAAYRTIGQAVLNAKAMQPMVERVLETLADALGCDYAVLYLVDDSRRWLQMAAGVGRAITAEWQSLARFPLAGRHPAVSALQDRRMLTVRASDESQDRTIIDRLGLHKFVRTYLPLHAAGEELGTLELGYASGRARFGEDHKRTLAAFMDQAAIAVHNMLLLRRTDEALARKTAEISVGREIQLSLLPKSTPSVPGWDFAAAYQAARTVGGDFYDFYQSNTPPARLGIVIADVADKGVPAALFMAVSRTVIRSVAFTGRGPAAALTRANQLLLADSQAELFLSAAYAILKQQTGRVTYANAGHNYPLWYHADSRTVTELRRHGTVLGAFDDINLGDETINLAPGDALVFYTDGITDALNDEGEMFGEERLQAVVAASCTGSAEEVLWAITGALAGFMGETEQADDVTCVVAKRV